MLKTKKKSLALLFSLIFLIGISGCSTKHSATKKVEPTTTLSDHDNKKNTTEEKSSQDEEPVKETTDDTSTETKNEPEVKKEPASAKTSAAQEAPTAVPVEEPKKETTQAAPNNSQNTDTSVANTYDNSVNKQSVSTPQPSQPAQGQGYTFLNSNAGPVIGDSKTHIYHLPTQRNYKIRSDHYVRFNSQQEAQSQGYRISKR